MAAFGSTILVAEAYKRCTTPEQKSQWEGVVKTHHGEAGFAIVAIGIGLMVHDINDRQKWFQ